MAGLLRSCAARSALRRLSGTEPRRRFAAACAVWDDDDEDNVDFWDESSHVPLDEGTCGDRGPRGVQWVFMGTPGVQKRLYAARMAHLLDVPYISMGTLVRQELHPTSSIYLKIANSVNEGRLVPEEIIFGLLSKRLEERFQRGETGFILDGIPRTRLQAEILDGMVDIDLVVNFKSKDETIIKKQIEGEIGTCSHCGKPFNRSQPETTRCNPCLATHTQHAQVHSSAVVGLDGSRFDRIHLHSEQSKLLEDYYREQRKLMNFQVSGGPGETWKGLLAALQLQHIDAPNSPQKLTV
ncbi:adenylate kinase [Rhynchospora pubera]|uniref:adenylate kinase n=1 Tax=Rhynchospora pubera TaxID=906938 RepID=A0AAV8GVU0_9POAL|nr:adenylate kinase [Rhynchospora pubera]